MKTLLLRLDDAQFQTLARLAYEGKTTKTALIREWIAKAEAPAAPAPKLALPSFVVPVPNIETFVSAPAVEGDTRFFAALGGCESDPSL